MASEYSDSPLSLRGSKQTYTLLVFKKAFMNNSHYPDLERCKKLTEVGFPETDKEMTKNWDIVLENTMMRPVCLCPSVMEMLDIIPNPIEIDWNKSFLSFCKTCATYSWYEYEDENMLFEAYQPLPNALADMILWLHENKHITF